MKIGILGGGQLGMMLAQAASALNHTTLCLHSTEDCPAASVTDVMVGDFNDIEDLHRFADQVDVITYEWENIPVDSLNQLISANRIYPPLDILRIAQDRLLEKCVFVDLAIPTPKFAAIESQEELAKQTKEIGFPCVLKTRCMGYDGKGQFVLRSEADIAAAWQAIQGDAAILEKFIKFDREVSLIAVRNQAGDSVYYPLVENQHQHGILRVSKAPFIDAKLQALAEKHAEAVLKYADYVGVLTLEFFQVEGELLANEMAPRVHNSGHWSIEGAVTSQFENHIRAITGQTLGKTTVNGYAAMVNFIGREPEAQTLKTVDNVVVHSYGKSARTGRKLGHATLVADKQSTLDQQLKNLQKWVKDDG